MDMRQIVTVVILKKDRHENPVKHAYRWHTSPLTLFNLTISERMELVNILSYVKKDDSLDRTGGWG
jgi:hypothetical protein